MPPALTVAILGLPGAGKSTLCRGLMAAHGWAVFLLGEALRARASDDADLRETLARGELAPESIAIELIRGEASRHTEGVLLVDGFPRHPDQFAIAKDLFRPLVGLVLDVSPDVAQARLRARRPCPRCGWSGIIDSQTVSRCPVCDNEALSARPEDDPTILPGRLAEADSRLQSLLGAWRGVPLLRIDGTRVPDEVLRQAEAVIESARPPEPH